MNLGALEGAPASVLAIIAVAVACDLMAYVLLGSVAASQGSVRRRGLWTVLVGAVLLGPWLMFALLPLGYHLAWIVLAHPLRRRPGLFAAAFVALSGVAVSVLLLTAEPTYLAPRPMPHAWFFGLAPIVMLHAAQRATDIGGVAFMRTFEQVNVATFLHLPSLLFGALPLLATALALRWSPQSFRVLSRLWFNRGVHICFAVFGAAGWMLALSGLPNTLTIQSLWPRMAAFVWRYLVVDGEWVAAAYFATVAVVVVPLRFIVPVSLLAFAAIGPDSGRVLVWLGIGLAAIGWPLPPQRPQFSSRPRLPGVGSRRALLVAVAVAWIAVVAGARPRTTGLAVVDPVRASRDIVQFDGFAIDVREQIDRDGGLRQAPTSQAAAAICEARGGRLCGEREWEGACRGATNREWPWEGGFRSVKCPLPPLPIGANALCRSPEGLVSMASGAFEWVYSEEAEFPILKSGGPYAGGYGSRCGARILLYEPDRLRDQLDLTAVGVRCCYDPDLAANPTTRPSMAADHR